MASTRWRPACCHARRSRDGPAGPGGGSAVRPDRPPPVVITGSILLVLSMLAGDRNRSVRRHRSRLLLGAIHLLLSTGLAFLFTPAFTTALNPLPPNLYSHGSAILSTLQQVSGAAGVRAAGLDLRRRVAPAPASSPACTRRS